MTPPGPKTLRVLVVDDSPTMRELLVSLLQEAGNLQVVGTGADGEDAVRLTARLHPDVVTLDVRMPRLDGLEATRRIMRETPTPIVIVCDTTLHRDIDLTFEALRAGALTVVNKPRLDDAESVERLVQTVRLMAGVAVVHHWGRHAPPAAPPAAPPVAPAGAGAATTGLTAAVAQRRIDVAGIASSTGGPAVLAALLRDLPSGFPAPILVVQHVTRGFTPGLAEWLGSQTALQVALARHGEPLRPGTVLLAPDDYHLAIDGRGQAVLHREAPYRGLRPSANFLFHSLARHAGRRALGIILTGMGDDGAEGIAALHQAGGLTLAQDRESSVVYGMPHEAVVRQAIDHVLPPERIAVLLQALAVRRGAEPLAPR